jgi:hypothetical protein
MIVDGRFLAHHHPRPAATTDRHPSLFEVVYIVLHRGYHFPRRPVWIMSLSTRRAALSIVAALPQRPPDSEVSFGSPDLT